LREKAIRDEFIFGRNAIGRVKLLRMKGWGTELLWEIGSCCLNLHAAEKARDFFERALRAERPMRCKGLLVRACRRSSDRARCAPRLVGTSA